MKLKLTALVCFIGLAGILLLWSNGSISFQYLPNAAVQAANQAVTSGTNMVAQVTARRQPCRCRSLFPSSGWCHAHWMRPLQVRMS